MSGLVSASGATLRRARVMSIQPATERSTGKVGYDVCSDSNFSKRTGIRTNSSISESARCEFFNSVIIASPLEAAGIDLHKSIRPKTPMRKYHQTVATFVLADGLSAAFFGDEKAKGGMLASDTVVTTSNPEIPFNSVAVHGMSAGQRVYKLFSEDVPSEKLFSKLFVNASSERRQFVWQAYPELAPKPQELWPPFRLHQSKDTTGFLGGVYYANAMETPVSCMETEAVAARNVALLVSQDFANSKLESRINEDIVV
eukprot:TRINITY_DN52687_c0_g1_i1.p1 TRINITY_DN52687_c0_g1~~TRINITY_DN52687_c0_g1_i1.p1  ORF type:complete len:271 (-),score=42.27 TRINITY_DN52687_c0_g1_i1:59-829(-)